MTTVLNNLKRIRGLRGMSLRDVERALWERGHDLSPQQLSKLERGEDRLKVDQLQWLAQIYKVTASELLTMGWPKGSRAEIRMTGIA